jgi:signal transduction histidine kinase
MTWTHVRVWRESFVLTGRKLSCGSVPVAVRRVFHPVSQLLSAQATRLPTPTAVELMVLFVALQVVEFCALGMAGRLDTVAALCISASLVTVAGLFARRLADQATPVIRLKPDVADEVALPFVQSPSHQASQAIQLGIAEESATWVDLMARISHEIRTPLNAVIGFSDLMGREIFGPLGHGRYADYAAHIKDSGEALLKSAEDTLALSSLLARPAVDQRLQTTPLHALIGDAWRSLEPQAARRGVTLHVECALDVVDVSGDRRALRQVVLNLMTEALARAKDDTSVLISAQADSDIVRLLIAVPLTSQQRREQAPSLPVCIASALMAQLGSKLAVRSGHGTWEATAELDRATQSDFFGTP